MEQAASSKVLNDKLFFLSEVVTKNKKSPTVRRGRRPWGKGFLPERGYLRPTCKSESSMVLKISGS